MPVPVKLPSNQFDHFYRGGDRIGALRHGPGGPQRPEEWIGSATTRFGEALQGLSHLPDGMLLRDAVAADPVSWLGAAHVDRYGSEGVELLVKLLDPNQRLPVHAHPQRPFAQQHLGSPHGKTEAWIILESDPGAVVGLGFNRVVEHDEMVALVRAHDSDTLLDLMVTRTVRAGDGIFVPAGVPHYIDPGILIVELQEPTDFSILLEWDGLAVDGDSDGHLGLGFDLALQAVDRSAWTQERVQQCVRPLAAGAPTSRVLPKEADAYFRAHRLAPGDGVVKVEAGLAILMVLEGSGELTPAAATSLPVQKGDAVLVPWCSGEWELTGAVSGILCRPPAPDVAPPLV